jgi:ribosomal protein S18 acetylase RimI-like enzyme
MMEIRPARFPRDLEVVRGLFREYADGLGIDLCFQGFEEELAALPGKYAQPQGTVLLAWNADEAMGCAALRPIKEGEAEMKRLYVKRGARGTQLGRRLAECICEEARAAGYARICLDTLPSMQAAVALYTSLGFKPIEPYVYNPIPGALFLARQL